MVRYLLSKARNVLRQARNKSFKLAKAPANVDLDKIPLNIRTRLFACHHPAPRMVTVSHSNASDATQHENGDHDAYDGDCEDNEGEDDEYMPFDLAYTHSAERSQGLYAPAPPSQETDFGTNVVPSRVTDQFPRLELVSLSYLLYISILPTELN